MKLLIQLSRFITAPVSTTKSFAFTRKTKIIIESVSRKKDGFFFMYIGANDGKTGSLIYPYIRRFNWKGIFVEPQKDAFIKLKKNYVDCDGLHFVNGAIFNKDGYVSFYESRHSVLSSLSTDEWFKGRNKGVAYLKRKLFGKSKKVKVKSYRLDSLIDKYNVEKIDLLFVDTEGSDFAVLSQLDFDSIKPLMIFFEIIFFVHEKERLERMFNKLKSNGYIVITDGYNAFAYMRLAI